MAVLVCIAGAAVCAHAGEPTDAAGGSRIGYVDMGRALNKVSDGVAAKKQLKVEFKERQQRLDILQKELVVMREELDRKRLVLSTEVLDAKERAYRQKLIEVQHRFSDFQRKMAEREARLTDEILKNLRGIVRDIGDREDYALILEKSQEIVLYAPGADDLTDRVIKDYNRGSRGKRRR